MKRLLIILIFIFGYFTTMAQIKISPEWSFLVEQWCIQNEKNNEEIFENLTQLYENPINLNDTTKINELFILTPHQQKALTSYILQYGQLLSINELHMINGFDSITINLLKPITEIKPLSKKEKLSLHNILKYGHHNFVIGANTNIEQARGYNENIYDGNSARFYYRYYFKYKDRIQLMLSGEKDPGEALFRGKQPHGFDFYGYHLFLKDIGPLKRTIIGQYYLQFGQGLTLWSGFNPYSTTNIYRYAQGIRPAGVFTEYGYFNGIASTAQIHKHIELTLFYSNVNRSATIQKDNQNNVQSLYNSGYHRTISEINKKNIINEQLWGANIQYNQHNFHIGTTLQQIKFSKNIIPKETPYNIFSFTGNKNINIGIDASYLLKKLLIFGEFAMSKNNGIAGLFGIQLPLKNNSIFSAYYRNFSKKYQNLYATSLGQNSHPQNEKGLYLSLSTILPLSITTQLSADFFKFPWLKYKVYNPSYGSEYKIQLSKNLISKLNIGTLYSFKTYENNEKIDNTNHYILKQNYHHRLQAYFKYTSKNWNFITRINNSWYSNNLHKKLYGILISQDFQYNPQNTDLTIAARIALFNAPEYEVRLYTVENNLQYEFNMNSFMHQGARFYLVIHYNINNSLSIHAKYGITYYPKETSIGSGYNIINTNHQQNIKLQIRWKF